MRRVSIFALAIAVTAFAGSASADTIVIRDVETGNPYTGNVYVSYDNSHPWTTPILMTSTTGQTYVVYCDDLEHNVYVGSGQSLPYAVGRVTVAGNGAALTQAQSNIMGQIADIGRYDYLHGNENGAIAAQAAIWAVEYKTTVSSSDSGVESFIQNDLSITDNGRGWAAGWIGLAGQQSQIIGAVPEPASWSMLVLGFGMIGFAARRRSKGLAIAA